jgi:hypothetical protein
LYPKTQTKRLQEATLRAVLLAVGRDPAKFLREHADIQAEFWPAGTVSEPNEQGSVVASTRGILEYLQALPQDVQIRACRAAAVAVFSSVAEAGGQLPEEAYRRLRELDVIQSKIHHLQAVS